MFCIIDCNNFYASCESLFRPDLHNKPIIVLSNNDGCVIARSKEAKALGIPMGIPYFKVKALCKSYQIQVFSANYALYNNLSQRVMRSIEDNWPHIEIYSIDEAFLDLTTLPIQQIDDFCWRLQRIILKNTGIPTSIGIGKTKTLAKAANHIAKKTLGIPVFNILGEESKWLSKLAIKDVWGIGKQGALQLASVGITNALQLADADLSWIKKRFSVTLQRTALELAGIACLDLEDWRPKQSIISSCSFGSLQSEFNFLQESISYHAANAWEKLRKQKSLAHYLAVFIRSNPFRKDLAQQVSSLGFRLIQPTDDLRILTKIAKRALEQIYRKNIQYHKAGILLTDLQSKQYKQQDLFHEPPEEISLKTKALMKVMDDINTKYETRTIHLAAEGLKKAWSMKRQMKSPHYTTSWNELPLVY